MTKISNFEEKKWILAYFMKRCKKISRGDMLRNWIGWWKDDFVPASGYKKIQCLGGEVHNWNGKNNHTLNEDYTILFNIIYKFTMETINKLSIEEIKEKLYQVKDKSGNYIPKKVYYKAKKLGFLVRKNVAGKKYPLRVCGYYVYKDGNIVYGKNYDLDLNDIKKFLQKEQQKNREKSSC
ncbi:hypothetical protein [Kineothrix sp. MB12-C1]|uniref:hypothetical protein n=1 Tax=Kineothrix sp. MB12-C1 TaxID=3070215 RepID=UPI0027D32A4E|nr:hypothetical protein [Kineothrix sp. MB12-C1]WMC93210.1 hypothetical protein RBB56_02690 [Kineothrix sp. MB12-C1]